MTRRRRQFDASFKLEVVRMVRDQGLSVGEVRQSMQFGESAVQRCMGQVMVRGLKRVDQMFVLSIAAYNLVRMQSLGQIRPQLR
jgi:transposase-like protein